MIIEKVNEQLLRLFWGFKTLTLTRSWTLEHLVVHRSHFKKVHLREIDRQRVATIARQRQRERGAAEMEEPAIVSRRPPSWPSVRRWWVVVVSLYRKREAEESKGTVVGAGGIRGRRPSCTHHLSLRQIEKPEVTPHRRNLRHRRWYWVLQSPHQLSTVGFQVVDNFGYCLDFYRNKFIHNEFLRIKQFWNARRRMFMSN
ncbi:hypothetical protein HanRHA438_Chr04g0157831 [Helianthus annuus]|uniref:Uncharacterized protein n=1 Tax=Helianthus annuus TaxID=4232 RepID=A0A9K3NPU7_HELAN|nr:hypothetical protein HanXRQr2_Chr04g0147691 [Helianthus annuus]KAJ0587068.1 hypothetical protein HanIR_Chr04g0159011 [Helianthus annuus]KAJ0595657.1 hypothetical protein HanHA89_Chr04g0133941 [Helianthus annuus]KAJ0756307.1 hypothetical protein HanLR1_Chr04g0125711 [Helianthus annuus]KAJ0925267.1 hypothetical protein HanRHA438_Chr04g0157831 [Helianthus annuus]